MASPVEGQLRVARRLDEENEKLARKLEESENRSVKKGRREEGGEESGERRG